MGLETDDPNSTPKLTLSKLPYCKTRERNMKTPPLRSSVSIPFRWEEVPGKPREAFPSPAKTPPSSRSNKSTTVARCLELPPRLLHDDPKFTVTPSPTTVLDGPYVGRSLSLACTFSFRKGPPSEGLRPAKKGSAWNFGSARWGSFKDEAKFRRGSFDFPHSLGEIFKCEDNNNNNVKATRVKRKRSFFSLSTINSKYSWADIYESVKQAVPWRRRKTPPVSCSNMNMA